MSSKTCFVIFPIGDPGTGTRTRADQVFKHIIEPVVSALGYEATRADEMRPPGVITSQVLAAVADSDLVVADLTDHDANVFYELAIRHATQRPLVQLIDSAQTPPFDVADMRTIYMDIHDLDSAEDARHQLQGHIHVARAAPSSVETPIAVARSMKALWESEEPAAAVLAEALKEIRALERERIRREGGSTAGDPAQLLLTEELIGEESLPVGGSPLTGRTLSTRHPLFATTGQPVFTAPSTLELGRVEQDPSTDGEENHDVKAPASTKSRKARKRSP
jgi:hypothetical protein